MVYGRAGRNVAVMALGAFILLGLGVWIERIHSRSIPLTARAGDLAKTPALPPLRIVHAPGLSAPGKAPSDPDREWSSRRRSERSARSGTLDRSGLVQAHLPALSPSALGTFQVSRQDVLSENNGVYAFNSPHYNATLAPGGIEFGLPGEFESGQMPLLSYSLREVRVNGQVLIEGGPMPLRAQPEDRSLSIDRGSVEERYVLGRERMEQLFVIRELPEGRGPIAVSGSVDTNLTPPEEGFRGSGLNFTRDGASVLSISDAQAIDAAGRTVALDLVWKKGQLELTVPESWVARATLPITIDPAIAGMDRFGTVSINAGNVDVAYNSALNEWLVVFANVVGTSGGAVDIDAIRVGPTGIPVNGPTLTVGANPPECSNPVVSYAPEVNRYLVVWVRAGASTSPIVGRVLNSDGTPFSSEFTISTVAGANENPSVAWDGTNWYVVYDTFFTGLVRGMFVSSAGVPGPEVDPEPANTSVQLPVVRFGNGVYVIIWDDYSTNPRRLMARTLSPATRTFLTPATVLSQSNAMEYDIAAGGGLFLAVWYGSGVQSAAILTPSLAVQTGPIQLYPREDPTGTGSSNTWPKVIFSTVNQDWYVLDSEEFWFQTGPFSFLSYGDILGGRHVSRSGVVSPRERLTDGSTFINGTSLTYNAAANQAMFAIQMQGVAAGRVDLGFAQIPTGLVAIPGNGQVTLTWNAMTGATSYSVARATAPGGPFQDVGTFLGTPTFTDVGLTNGTTYTYLVTAHILGNDTPPAQISSTPEKFALLVVGNTTLGAGDAAIQTRLQNLGFTVVVKKDSATSSADAAGVTVILISSTVTANNVNTKFRSVAVPVLNWKSTLMNPLGMTGASSGTNFGTKTGQTQVSMVAANSGNPLAAGLTGVVTVVTASDTFTFGQPNASGWSIATLSGDATRSVIFAYDQGAAMPGLAAPARRVGLFLTNTTASHLTANGGALVDAAIQWAAGSGSGALASQALIAGAASSGAPTITLNGQGNYATIQEAIDAAGNGDTVILAPMTFSVSGGLVLKEGVSLRGTAPHQTILDGQGASTVVLANGSNLGSPSLIEHLTLTGGGVGLNAPSASVFLRNVQIVRLTGNGLVTGPQSAIEGVSLTITDNGGSGIVLGSPQAILRGLIVARNGGAGLTGPPAAQITYSSFFGNAGGAASGGVDLTGAGNLFVSFGFQNPAGLDYRELPGSPSINAGNPADAFRLEPEPNGGRVNQGAFGNTPFATP